MKSKCIRNKKKKKKKKKKITNIPVALLLLWLLLLIALKKAAALVSRVLLKIQNILNSVYSDKTDTRSRDADCINSTPRM
jgi:beta-lactamase regulating signal transducer with metallopeptidase domain